MVEHSKVSEKNEILSDLYFKMRSALQKVKKKKIKGIKFRKGEVKLSLFADDINLYIAISKKSIKKTNRINI